MSTNKIDENKARDFYYEVVEKYTNENFSKEVEVFEEQYNDLLKYYLGNISTKKAALLDIDVEVGKLVRRHELKGFMIGLMCAEAFKQQAAITTVPKLFDKPETESKLKVNGINLSTGRRCRFITTDGAIRNVSEWCKAAGIHRATAYAHLNKSEENFIAYIKLRMGANK